MATTKITSPELFDLASFNSALKLPSGTTAQRPTSPSTGEWRYNTTTNLVEFYDGGAWRELQSENLPPIPTENFEVVTYQGNGASKSISSLSFSPSFVWIKRYDASADHFLTFEKIETGKQWSTNSCSGRTFNTDMITSFDSNGFTLGSNQNVNLLNGFFVAYCFNINEGVGVANTDGSQNSNVEVNDKTKISFITYSGTGFTTTVGHGLGVVPEFLFTRDTNNPSCWWIWHKDLAPTSGNNYLQFSSSSQVSNTSIWNGTVPNSSVFNLGNDANVNGSGRAFMAFAMASVDGFSKVSSYTGNGSTSGPVVNTGFKPAFIMVKGSTVASQWNIIDNKRDTTNPASHKLYANLPNAEAISNSLNFLSNGFQIITTDGGYNANGDTYIYIAFAGDESSTAPVLADSFARALYAGTGLAQTISSAGFRPSFLWNKQTDGTFSNIIHDTLNQPNLLITNSNGALITNGSNTATFTDYGFSLEAGANHTSINNAGSNYIYWAWKANSVPTINTDGDTQAIVSANAAAGFSIMTYSGTGSVQTIGHGLSASPEFIIIKKTSNSQNWNVGTDGIGWTKYLELNQTGAAAIETTVWNNTAPSSTVITLGGSNNTNANGEDYVMYAFASISGFSKIGSYTGDGTTTKTITTGFQPDFVLIKVTDGTDNWVILDSARGGSKNLKPNSSAAEATESGTNVEFISTGFKLIGSGAGIGQVNSNGNNYIYLAFKDNFEYASTGSMAFMLIAGGGGGGVSTGANTGITYVGCGGGAGGFRGSGKVSGGGCSPQTDISLAAGTYTVTIGAGGSPGVSGSTSSIAGPSLTTITTTGGGRGASSAYQPEGGGSAGGRSTHSSANQSAVACEGFPALEGSQVSWQAGGGGAGGAQTTIGSSNASGIGVESEMTGTATYYAGGGAPGGFNTTSRPQPQEGGGGQGQLMGETAVDTPSIITGTINTGAGGGGGSNNTNTGAKGGGGSGGSGFAVLRLKTAEYSGTVTGSPTVTTSEDETIIQFTGSGTYVHS